MKRRQLPGYSPITLRSLRAGLWTALVGGARNHREAVLTEISRQIGARRGSLLTDSGTSALALAIEGACHDRAKNLVALPAYCCFDVATAADAAGATIILYDVDPNTLSPEPRSLATAIDRGPAALALAHLYGIPVDFEPVERVCRESGVTVVEDAAQGHMATYRGKPLGSLGSLSVLSFGRGKGATGGSGGALLANDDTGARILERARHRLERSGRGLDTLLKATAQWVFGRPALYWIPASLPFLGLGETVYLPPHAPREMSDAATAILARTWHVAMAEAANRVSHAKRLAEIVSPLESVRAVTVPSRSVSGYIRFPVTVGDRLRTVCLSDEARGSGVMPGYPKCLADLPGFADRCVNRDAPFPGARLLARHLFTLPTHGKVAGADLDRMTRLLAAPAPQR